jgi:hypothetical protein
LAQAADMDNIKKARASGRIAMNASLQACEVGDKPPSSVIYMCDK